MCLMWPSVRTEEKRRGYNASASNTSKITLAEVGYTFIVKRVEYLENKRKITKDRLKNKL